MTTIVAIKIENREETSKHVQAVLTDFGCDIRTRLGINDYKPEDCTTSGLIIVDIPNEQRAKVIVEKLSEIKNVKVKTIEI